MHLQYVTRKITAEYAKKLVRKKNEVALQRAEMRMVRWMCDINVKDRVPSKEFRERPRIDEMIVVVTVVLLLSSNIIVPLKQVNKVERQIIYSRATQWKKNGNQSWAEPDSE